MEEEPRLKHPTEKEAKFGRKVRFKIYFFRHGDKDGEMLSQNGVEQAQKIGSSLEPTPTVKGYSSQFPRARYFSENIVEMTRAKRKLNLRQGLDLGEENWFNEGFVNWWRKHGLKGYLDLKDQRPVVNTPSAEEVAARVAHHFLTQIKIPEKCYSGSEVTLVNTSHSGILEPFFIEALGKAIEKDPVNKEGKDFIEKMGGAFNTAEGFEVDVKIDENGEKTVKLTFRGKNYEVDFERLEELVKKYPKEYPQVFPLEKQEKQE
ncbi:MAG: phosphoglycerate mutase family protein [Ignavibacterium sp.]|nr:phosphoglycerate mutase family protein [Ignavibacterium sp.]